MSMDKLMEKKTKKKKVEKKVEKDEEYICIDIDRCYWLRKVNEEINFTQKIKSNQIK